MGGRSFYIDDFTDEAAACEPTLEGWAAWLAAPEADDGFDRGRVYDGQSFRANALLWKDDIVARRENGAWTLSRDPEDKEFIAVRFGEGLGWSADQIIEPEPVFNEETREYDWPETRRDALLKWLGENDQLCEDVEFVACGSNENGWILTFHAGPPARCSAERSA